MSLIDTCHKLLGRCVLYTYSCFNHCLLIFEVTTFTIPETIIEVCNWKDDDRVKDHQHWNERVPISASILLDHMCTLSSITEPFFSSRNTQWLYDKYMEQSMSVYDEKTFVSFQF